MTENELIDLQDKGMVNYKFLNGFSTICIVLKVRFPSKDLIAYMGCISETLKASEHAAIDRTLRNGMKLNRAEALGFFPEQVKHIVKHYYTD